MLLQDCETGFHRGVMVGRAPVAGERRIEHLAEPVDDDRLAYLAQDAAVDARIIFRRLRGARQRTARHHDQAPAHALDRLDLLLVGADDVVDRHAGLRIEMIRAGAAGDLHAGTAARGSPRINPFAPFQSRPMPRCAVSIASATPRPRSHRYSRNAIVLSQSTAASSHGSLSASGSATTCAAA